MTVPRKIRSIIEATLAFANLPAIDSDEQVQAVFQKLPFGWAVHHRWLEGERGHSHGPRSREGYIHPDSLQRQVRRWLEGIAQGDKRRVRHIAASVNDALRHTTRLTLGIDPESLRLTTDFQIGFGLNAEDVCALGVAYLFEGLLRRIRQCPIDGCGRFRITFQGKPWNYCSLAHQREGERLAAIKRVKAWRIYGPKKRRRGGKPR